jgi:hypothetical protein
MKKYKVKIAETYNAIIEHEVEAKNEQQAEELAGELHAEHTTPIEDINFIEWEIEEVIEL